MWIDGCDDKNMDYEPPGSWLCIILRGGGPPLKIRVDFSRSPPGSLNKVNKLCVVFGL